MHIKRPAKVHMKGGGRLGEEPMYYYRSWSNFQKGNIFLYYFSKNKLMLKKINPLMLDALRNVF